MTVQLYRRVQPAPSSDLLLVRHTKFISDQLRSRGELLTQHCQHSISNNALLEMAVFMLSEADRLLPLAIR